MSTFNQMFPATLLFVPMALAAQSTPRPIASHSMLVHPDSVTVAYSQFLWPKIGGVATVPYIIDSGSDSNATPKIQSAISTFNADFPGLIQWVLWSPAQAPTLGPNYVDINLSAGNLNGQCEADEGYEAKAGQSMGGSTSCTVGTILHEMGHVIGLWHEQTRSDRDTYVEVSFANVIKGSWGNFLIATDDEQFLSAFDYASVMQYIPFAFSRNGGPVIESVPAGMPLSGYEGVPAVAGAIGVPSMPTFDYSAGDKETIERLYGAPPTQITVTSNPVGLSVIVDGTPTTTPQNFSWALYTTHTLDVSPNVQTLSGAILNSVKPGVTAANFYYTYGRWSDSTAQTHSITVTPGNGSLTFPNTKPQVATYSANFIQLVPYTATISPANSGQVTASPAPQTYPGSALEFYVARQQVTLTATPNSGWNFYEFNNAPYWLPGGLGANPKTFYVPDTGNPVNTTVEFSNTPVYTVDVQPNSFSSNIGVQVDQGFAFVPKNFSSSYDTSWTPTSSHTLSIASAQKPYDFNTRFNFVSWSDGGAITHNISLPAAATQYTASVTPQYVPSTFVNFPPCGGTTTLSPASPSGDGFYPTGQHLTFTATPDMGWLFAGWSYDLSGITNPHVLVANDETLAVGIFNTVNTPLTLTALKPNTAVAGRAGFTLTLTGTGFTPNTLVSVNGQFPAVTFSSATKITVPVSAADVASLGAFPVYAENFPTGSNGCAVFANQTFLVTGPGAPAAEPTFSPPGGTYTAAQMVSILDAIPGATIHYTTDGSTPTSTSAVYSTPITVGATEQLKANAVATGHLQSATAAASYTIKAKAATPTFSPPAGAYKSPQSVMIADATPGAAIYYTTNDTTPTTASTPYSGAIAVSASETLKALAVATGFSNSAVASGAFNIAAAPPTFSPPAGTYAGSVSVMLSDTTSGASFFYTTDGSSPSTSSTPYAGSISITSTEKLKAIAVAPGHTQSTATVGAYTIK